jgi:hypothetical protein
MNEYTYNTHAIAALQCGDHCRPCGVEERHRFTGSGYDVFERIKA